MNFLEQKHYYPEILHQAFKLARTGKLALSPDNLVYLDIDDDYIHKLYPFLNDVKTIKPDYFSKDSAIGAHISVIYPEEKIILHESELDKIYSFEINELTSIVLGSKKYYALTVVSPSLLLLRQKYNLPTKLLFKGYRVDLHITIGVQISNE